MFLIDKLFFPKISFKLTIEPRMKIYDRITSYIYELNQMVLRKEKTMLTFKSYENSLSKFRVWGNKMRYLSVNKEMIQKYKAFLISEQLLPSTINLYLVALRKFLEYCADNNWIVENPAQSVSAVKQKRGIFKGDSLTIVVLTSKVFDALDEYLKQRGFSNPENPLFTREVYRPK